MANNRLYLVDTESGEFICLAKSSDLGWSAGNIDIYKEFLSTRFSEGIFDHTNLVIGTENDPEFYRKWIKGKDHLNQNTTNKWE